VIVAVVGADGAGKSTLTGALAARLRTADHSVRTLRTWDIVGNPAYPAAGLLRNDVPAVRGCVARMPSMPRFLFLMWAAVTALGGDQAEPGRAPVSIVDGGWAKHAASEVVYGADRDWVEHVIDGLPQPDLTVYLRLAPESAWDRKDGRPAPYECGMDLDRTKARFLRHQYGIQRLLDRWADRFGWLTIDAAAPPPTVLAAAAGHIERAWPRPLPSTTGGPGRAS
jgi:thymidylate kinase